MKQSKTFHAETIRTLSSETDGNGRASSARSKENQVTMSGHTQMKKIGAFAVISSICIISLVSSVDAFSVLNRDARPHLLTIFEGDDQREVSLGPDEQGRNLCNSTCEVFLDDRPEVYEVAATDTLSIEDGVLLGAEKPFEEITEEPKE